MIGNDSIIKAAYDVTECCIKQPMDFWLQQLCYSGKMKQHTVKYEMAVNIHNGSIVWLAGPFHGSIHDVDMTRSLGILNHLLLHERLLGDKGYIGEGDHRITPFQQPQTEEERAFNREVYRYRIIVENTYLRLKTFNCLKHSWRQDIQVFGLCWKY
jgi:hypothetical protein